MRHSEDFGSSWSAFNVTVTQDGTISPDGWTNANLLSNTDTSEDGTNTVHYVQQSTNQSGLNEQTVTFSVWLKAATPPGTTTLRIIATSTYDYEVQVQTTWRRFHFTKTLASGDIGTVYCRIQTTSGDLDSLYAWGAQFVIHDKPAQYVQTEANRITGAYEGQYIHRLIGSNQVRGTATISDTNTTTAVSLPNTEPDTNYFIIAQVSAKSGSAASGSTRCYVTDKTTAGFDLHVEVAPGSSQSVTIDWLMLR